MTERRDRLRDLILVLGYTATIVSLVVAVIALVLVIAR